MRKPLVAGNWKMNGTLESNAELLSSLMQGVSQSPDLACDIAIFPPAVYLYQVAKALYNSTIKWGLQNVNDADQGAFTGEHSSLMAKDMECDYTLVGHSERRILFNETSEQIAKKVEALIKAGIVPVLCVGETLNERDAGKTLTIIERQVKAVFDVVKINNTDIVIAYEPVWAIGTGRIASPEQAQVVHSFIRSLLIGYNTALSEKTRILYGGSVKADNAQEIFAQPDVDGGLVGGASLKAAEFIMICKAIGL